MKHPIVMGYIAAFLAIISSALATWSVLTALDTNSDAIKLNGRELRLEQAVVAREHPTERQMVFYIVAALETCHQSRSCSAELRNAKRVVPSLP